MYFPEGLENTPFKNVFGHKKLKKPPQKVVSEIFLLLPNSSNGRIHVPKCGL
jgi:hypothetical protein